MSENFGMVLITEHMHESLLLMKRMYVWLATTTGEIESETI